MKSRFASALLLLAAALPVQASGPKDVQDSMAQIQQAQSRIMQAMMQEKPSKFGFNETVEALKKAGETRGWKLAGVFDAQDAMVKAGHKDAKPMKILGMCHPKLAEAVLIAQQKAQMPPSLTCRFSVYESLDGKIYIMRFNTALMAQMTQGEVAAALNNLAKEEEALLAAVAK